MVLILLEGVDCAGKSTLAARIAEFVRASGGSEPIVLHKGPMTGNAIEEYEHPLNDYWPGGNQHIICDRWHLGELVYGPLLRGRTRVSLPEQQHIEKFLLRRGAIFVHVAAPSNEVRRRFAERGDDLIKIEQLPTIIENYHRAFGTSEVPAWFYDTTSHEEVLSVVHAAVAAETAAVVLDEFKTYVGSSTASLLVLGGARGTSAAFVPRAGSTAEYMLRNLPDDVNRCAGFANALEEDIGLLYTRLNEPMVVALGRDAAIQCEQAELPYGEVPDPQHIRRLTNDRGAEYGSAIREAALFRRDMTDVFASAGS